MSNVSPITNAYDGFQGGTPKVQTHFNCEALWIKESEFALVKSGTSIVIGAHNVTGGAPASGIGATASLIVGYNAAPALTTGWGNTVLGASSAPTNLQTGTGNIVLSNGLGVTDVSSATASNELHIGGSTVDVIKATNINTITPSFFLNWVPGLTSYTTDAAAAVGGVAVGQLYRNGSVLQVRIV